MDQIINSLSDILDLLGGLLKLMSEAYGSIPEILDTLSNATNSASEALAAMPSALVTPVMTLLYMMIALAAVRWIT